MKNFFSYLEQISQLVASIEGTTIPSVEIMPEQSATNDSGLFTYSSDNLILYSLGGE